MATKLMILKPETSLTNGIGVWDIRGKLCLAEMDEDGNALVGEALVLTRAEQGRLLCLLIERRNAGLLDPYLPDPEKL